MEGLIFGFYGIMKILSTLSRGVAIVNVTGCLVVGYTFGWSIVILVSSCNIVSCSVSFHSLSSLFTY